MDIGGDYMSLFIQRTRLEQAKKLWDIQKRAFEDDLRKYKDEMNPAKESLERLKTKIENFLYFTIFLDDKIIGGADIRKKGEGHYRLNRIYIDPDFQNGGLGYKSIKLVEDYFPDATIWDLDTPHLSFRNHHLYEKLGYKKVGEHKISEHLTLFDYIKEIK